MADLRCVVESLEEEIDRGSFHIGMWDEEGSELDFCLVEKSLLGDVLEYLKSKRDGTECKYVRDGLPVVIKCEDCEFGLRMTTGKEPGMYQCKNHMSRLENEVNPAYWYCPLCKRRTSNDI